MNAIAVRRTAKLPGAVFSCGTLLPLLSAALLFGLGLAGTGTASAAPANDNFASATLLGTTVSGSLVGTNVGATKEPPFEPNHAGNVAGASVWYRWVAPTNGTVTFNTATNTLATGFDTLLAVYTGSALSTLSLVAANDDIQSPSRISGVTFVASAGTTYQIAVDGYNGATGTFVLSWQYPIVKETIVAASITNVSNFLFDSDPNRDRLKLTTSIVSSNLSTPWHSSTFVLSCRLLNSNNVAHPIFDANGLTNAAYTYNTTNTFLIRGLSTATSSVPAALKPALPLDPYNRYTVELKVYRLGAFTGASSNLGPTVYLEFTNLVSGDLGLNTIGFPFGSTWSQTYAVKTAPGQTAFLVNAVYGLYRYDDFNTAAPTTNNLTVSLAFELHRASDGALVPLKNSTTNFVHPLPSYTAGTPKDCAAALFSDPLLLEPFNQLDSVADSYYAVVNLAVNNGVGSPLAAPPTQTATSQLLHFNGTLRFGGIATTLTSLGAAPPLNPPVGALVPTTLSNASGFVNASSDHTYAGAGPLSVNLDATGTAYVTAGSVVLAAPSPDTDSIANVRIERQPVTLTATGATGDLILTLPTGMGYRTNDTSSQVVYAKVPFPGLTLTSSLLPTTSDLTYAPGVPLFVAEESKPTWLLATKIVWHVYAGTFDFPTFGAGALFVRGADYAYLQSVSNLLVDPPNMGDKRSNDKYWTALTGLTGGLFARPDVHSNAQITASFDFGPGSFRTHFPYDSLVQWTDSGFMKISNDVVLATSGSMLRGATTVAVTYSQDCPDCSPGASLTTPTILVTNGAFFFTLDGGLVASGILPSTDLAWGYIDAPTFDFAQRARDFRDAVFHMPGVFVRGDQNKLPDVHGATTILYTGFLAGDLRVAERPFTKGYSDGFADYAGLNFRSAGDGAQEGQSTIAGTRNISWKLDARSKYYVRYAGVSGIHEAFSFPGHLTLWGYDFTFLSYGLSYLDSQNQESVTDGAIKLPYPSAFAQNFEHMLFTCQGAPKSADIPAGEGFKLMSYWAADFKTHSLRFNTPNGCSPGDGGYLILGIEGYASHFSKPLFGEVGFFAGGDQIPPSFAPAGISSRLKLPNVLSIEGPNQSTYTFTPAQDGYYNTYSNSPPSAAGWMNIFGKMDVPFFEDLQLHLQTSCHTNGVAASNAPIYLSGGWPRPGSGNDNFGWVAPGSTTPFETNLFDYQNAGWPAGTNTIANYRDNQTGPQFHPRAQRLWLGVVDFDYPLSWDTTLRSFKSWEEIQDDLLVIQIKHQVKYLDAKRAELDFGAQYDGLPKISIANLAFNAINETTGVGDAIVKAATKPIEDVLSQGLDEMDKLLNAQMKELMDGVFDKTINPVIDKFYTQLSNDWSGLTASQRLNFLQNVQTNTLNIFLGTGPNPATTTLTDALGDLGNGVNQANSLIGQIRTYLRDATNAIQAVVGEVTATNGISVGPPLVGLIAEHAGSRPIIPQLLNSLVGDIAPQFIDAVVGPTVSNLIQEFEPQLQQVSTTLNQTKSALVQVDNQLATAGQFTGQIQDILSSFTSQLSNVSFQVSLSTTQYFGQFDFHIDDPFQHVSAEDIKKFIRQKVEDNFFATDAAAQIQSAIRQRVYDVDAAMKSQIDTVFQQLNNMLRDLISQSLAEVDNSINQTLGKVSDVIGAGKLDGHALIVGDSLKELRIDGHFEFKVPDSMELDAFLLVKELTSNGSGGCYSSNAPATEVTLGALHVPVGWLSSDLKANVEAKFTFDGTVPFPVNLGGQLEFIGDLDFEAFQLHDLAAALAFGKYENYLPVKGGVRFNGYDFSGAVFFGKTCSLDPLKLIDPDVAKVIGDPPFTGAYCYAQGWLPISEMLTGVPASCLFEISAGIGAGAFYFAEGPTYGGKMFLGVSGSLLCVVSIEGDITLIGLKHGDDLRFSGHGHFEADIGPCPFCISVGKDVDISYINKSWHLD